MIINKKISPIFYSLLPNRSAFSSGRSPPTQPDTCQKAGGFTLIEAATALIILAFVCGSVLVVINRCIASAADSALKMQAFEVARENMEKLLANNSAQESVEYGTSNIYPEIEWQTVVETFYEPITERVWVKAICSAEYTDTAGQIQTVELTHWLTDVSKQQLIEILKRQQQQQEQIAVLLLGTIQEAAEYAGVDVQTIEQWIDNGLLTTDDGSFVKSNLDIYKEANGNPPPEVKDEQIDSIEELIKPTPREVEPTSEEVEPPTGQKPPDTRPKDRKPAQSKPEQKQPTTPRSREIEPITGLPYEELDKMPFWELWQLLMKKSGRG